MTEMGRPTFPLVTFAAFVTKCTSMTEIKKLSPSLSCLSSHLKRKKEKREKARPSSLPCLSPHLKRKKRKARKKLASLFSHTPLAQNRMFHRFQASFFNERKRFVHRDVAAFVSHLIDGQGTRGVELTSRKINVFSGMIVSVNEAREQAAFCQFAIHDSHPHTVTAV